MKNLRHSPDLQQVASGAASALALFAATAALAASSYTVTDLGVLPGGAFSAGLGINSAGQVSGNSDAQDKDGFGQRRFVTISSGMIDLGLPDVPFVLSSAAPALNDVGQVVVNGYNGAFHAFIWQAGAFTGLKTLPNAIYSEGHRINDAGHVVGSVVLELPDGSFPHHAFLYDGSEMIDLNPLFGGNYSDAADISQDGTIVGEARLPSGIIHGFILHDGRVTDIGPSPGITSEAESINSSGQVAGGAYFDGMHEHPMMYADGHVTDLDLLPQATAGDASGINDAGIVIGGMVFPGGIHRAFVYSDGQMKSLTDLLAPGSGWIIEEASDINSAGVIVATARATTGTGYKHAVKLTPVTCPADLSGDAVVNGLDLGQLLAHWGPCSAGCAADLNGDGVVNGLDLASLLAGWGACQ